MTTEQVHISHAIPERLRLRFPGRKGQYKFFHALVGRLVSVPEVRKVKANVSTGSVLIFRDPVPSEDWDTQLLAVLSEFGPSELVHQPRDAAEPTLFRDFKAAVGLIDEKIRQATTGQLDMRAASGLMFVGLGLLQMVRGKTLPAGMTLLNQGVFILAK